jgi:predicted nucleotidyltransferase
MVSKSEPEQRGYYEKKVINLHFDAMAKKERREKGNRGFYEKENLEVVGGTGVVDKNGHSTYHYYNRERPGKGGGKGSGGRR